MLLKDKRLHLESEVFKLGSALVAFSGGIDSTLVLAVANKVLNGRVLAVTAKSDSVPERELHAAQELTQALGIKHKIIRTEEMSSPNYLKNPSLLSVRILDSLTWNAAVCAAVSVADRSRQSPSNMSMMAPVIGCCPIRVFVWYSEGGRHLRYFDLTPIPTLLEKFMNHSTCCPSVRLCLEIQD